MTEKEAVKIVSLSAENVKRLRAITIEPSGNVVVIGGENEQGKTSALDCIEMAMAGKRSMPRRPVRDGEKKARAVVELDNGLIIKRTFTAGGGSTLTVQSKEGAKFASPQTMLDAMTGQLTFDPLAFSRMEPAKQLETLRKMVGIDFSAEDASRAKAFNDRRDLKRDLKELISSRQFVVVTDMEVPSEPVSVDRLWVEINAINGHARAEAHATDDVEFAEGEVERLKSELANARNELKRTSNLLESLESKRPAGDVPELEARIKSADDINIEIGNRAKRIDLDSQIMDKEDLIELSNQVMADIDKQKAETIAAAEFPIAGLSFGDDGVLFDGIPFEQASGAGKLRVSVAMGMALNPVLRVMLIRDGSLLSHKSLAVLAGMAEKADYQIWIERVGDGDECSVIIEDGEIK